MKRIFLFVLLLASTTAVIAQTPKPKQHKNKDSSTAKVKYTCTMHPEIISDKPGKCPKCGMTLIVKKNKKKSSTNRDR